MFEPGVTDALWETMAGLGWLEWEGAGSEGSDLAIATTQGIEVGDGKGDHPLGLPSGDAEQSKEILRDLIGGLGVIAFRVIMDELTETKGSAINDRGRQLRVGDGESPGINTRLDVAQHPGGEAPGRAGHGEPVVEEDLAHLGVAAVEAAEQAEALGEDHGWVVDVGGQLVEETAEQLEDVFYRRFEQLLLALEVVVEGTQPHVGGLGDLLDRDVEIPGGDEALGRADEGRPRARPAPIEPVACGCQLGHLSRLSLGSVGTL